MQSMEDSGWHVRGRATDGTNQRIWQRLGDRKVAQWGIAYIAGAWGFLQGLQYVSELFAWPDGLRRAAFIALLVALPIVLVIAWYHGDRGEQHVTGTEIAIVTLLFLLGGGVFWKYAHDGETAQAAAEVDPPSAQPASGNVPRDLRPSIAVLPFENRSDLRADAFFVDGIHDDILTQLAKVGSMKVIARTSVEQFRGSKMTTREIAGRLGVTTILEGGVQRAGDRVRINVQLIDAATDAHIWAERYDRELTAADIFLIQGEIAVAIADALRATLGSGSGTSMQEVPTQDLKAWEAYQLGRQRMVTRVSADMMEAEAFFRRAIERDPNFALAHVGLADALLMQISYGGAPREPRIRMAEQAVARALELDANLAEARATSGLIARNKRDYARAESMFRRAIEINPNDVRARHWYSVLLRDVGRADEALEQIQLAAELDPLSAMIQDNLGDRLAAVGRFREAEAAMQKAITIERSNPLSYWDLAYLQGYAFNRFAEAIPLARKAMELDSGSPQPAFALADLYLDLGDDARFAEVISAASKRWGSEPGFFQSSLALYRRTMGDEAGAAKHARRALETHPRDANSLAILRDADLKAGRHDAALARYRNAYPELLNRADPQVDRGNYQAAIDLAQLMQVRGETGKARVLLDGAERAIEGMPRLGAYGFAIADVQIHALRGDEDKALAALGEAGRVKWRWSWRYFRDFDHYLDSIRSSPQFQSTFAEIERDVAQQRAALESSYAPNAR